MAKKKAKANGRAGFLSISGEAKIRFYRREDGGCLTPFFEGLRFPARTRDGLDYLQDGKVLVSITLAEIDKSMFEPEEETPLLEGAEK